MVSVFRGGGVNYTFKIEMMKLFYTGFIQVFFVALNTFFIANKFYAAVFVCGFIISFIWCFNVKKVAFGDMWDKIYYSGGAACGSIIGLIVSIQIFNYFK
jgi:hypothetical protein